MAKSKKQQVDEVVVTSSKDTVDVKVDREKLAGLLAERGRRLSKIKAIESSYIRSQLAMKKMEEAVAELDGISSSLKDAQDSAECAMFFAEAERARLVRTLEAMDEYDELEVAPYVGPCGFVPYGMLYGARYYNGAAAAPRTAALTVMKSAGVPDQIIGKMKRMSDALLDGHPLAHIALRACHAVLMAEPVNIDACLTAASAGYSSLDDFISHQTGLAFPQALAALAAVAEARSAGGKSLHLEPTSEWLYGSVSGGKRFPGSLIYDASQSKKVVVYDDNVD